MNRKQRTILMRSIAAACLLAALGLAQLTAPAIGQESVSDLRDRMEEIQAELDETTAEVEKLRTAEEDLRSRIDEIGLRMRDLGKRKKQLEGRVIDAAQRLYRSGGSDLLEVLLTSSDLAELATRSQLMSRIAERDSGAFVEFSRTEDELEALSDELSAKSEELVATRSNLTSESERLQGQFEDVAREYDELKERLAEAAQRAAAEAERAVPDQPAPESGDPVAVAAPSTNGMTCPVAGPNSFIDSWGYPRSGGRTHEGTDIMAALGTPVVAIRSGTITYAGYGSSAGNWIVLSGDDGNSYWYMHNETNLVSGGSVRVGDQIATVGNTGNASGGPPHVHFEYHPGGGGPINPYPLLSGIC